MAFENRYASAKHPQMGHYRPICRQSADDGFGVVVVFAAFVGFGAVCDVFSRYARLGRCEHSSLLYGLFQRRGRQRKCRFGRVSSLIGASVGMATTWLHNGSALVMAGMMLSSTVCGIVLLWVCSHQAWMENDKKRICLTFRPSEKRFQTASTLY